MCPFETLSLPQENSSPHLEIGAWFLLPFLCLTLTHTHTNTHLVSDSDVSQCNLSLENR